MRRLGGGRVNLAGFTLAPGLLAIAGLFLVPMALFFVYSFLTAGFFSVSGPLTLENYTKALSFNGVLATNSAIVGVLVATVTVTLSLPIAYWLRYSAGRWRVPVLFLVTTSMLASYLVRIYAWRTVLGENGLLNTTLIRIGIVDAPVGVLLFSRFAIVVALVHIFLPYVILVLYAGFRPIEPDLLSSARDLGAGTVTLWRRVLLPLMAAPAVAAFLFVFVLSAADYVTPQFLGAVDDVMLGVQIQNNFRSAGNWPLGAASSFLMLAAFVLIYLLTNLALRGTKLDRIRWDA